MKTRYNREDFGYLVGFPNGDILLVDHRAGEVLSPDLRDPAALSPYLLEALPVPSNFHLKVPPLLWLELTRECNLRCPHCYIHGGERRAGELTTEEWKKVLSDAAQMGVWAVAFTGGEPTLHPGFLEIAQHAARLGLIIGLATNGMFLTDELLAALPKENFIISISWDDLHVDQRGGITEFEAATTAIRRAQTHGFLTNLMTNSHRYNGDKLQKVVDWAVENGVSIRSVPFSPIGRGKQHRQLESPVADVERAAQFWLKECEWEHEYHRKAGLCVGVIFNYGLSLAYMTRRCSSGRYLAYIAADGTVYPCTMCAAENLFSPGNISKRAFSEIWREPWDIRGFSWSKFEQACEGCAVNAPQYYCAARCPAMSFARTGTFNSCGASDFEKVSTIYRTGLLQKTATGQGSGLPIKTAP